MSVFMIVCSVLPLYAGSGFSPVAYANPPQGSVLLFEDNAFSMQAAGWTRRLAPVDGVYMIDSSHSLGNPNQTVTQSVPAGQYLFYGDQVASANTRYTSLSKKLPIGPGAWTLQFSARFVDLMKPSQNKAYRGISFEIFANNKEYKITFNDTNKILAMSNSSGAYVQQEATMPGDDDFHLWEIAYNGSATVSVKMDGAFVATFGNTGFPLSSPRADELIILNAPLDWQFGTNEVYIDSIAMYVSEQQYVPTDVLIDDDGASLGAAGWSRSLTPLNGLYITDHGNTLGNPSGVQMKAVPAGQYLFYGDEQASIQGKYTRLLKEVTIGQGAWTLEFSARFVDLMKPSANAADRGVYFDIYAAGKRYKITFNDTNKIWASSSAQAQVTMPADNNFHKWEIAFDGADKVRVKLDGATVASFTQIAASTTLSDRIQIANVPLNWVSGTNEVYLDYVLLVKTTLGDPNVLINDDASSFQTADWTVAPLAANAYFTDYGHTNGTVAGMLNSEEGRYLTYAAGTATGDVYMKKSVAIGTSPWALEVDAKADSLVDAGGSADKGFAFEVVAGGKLYKIVMNGADKLSVGKADGSYEEVAAGPLSSSFFDSWGIACDEHDRLIVTRNGSKLGVWTGAGKPVQQADGVTITNQAAGASGITKVWLDRIRLVKNMLPEWSEFQPIITGVTVLPDSDATTITAVVPLFDADPLRFVSNPLSMEADLLQDGQVINHVTQHVYGSSVTIALTANGRSGWMDLSLKLKDGSAKKSEAVYKLDVAPSVSLLQPTQTATSVTGHVYLFTGIDQAVDSAGHTAGLAGWQVADYTYDGTVSGGRVIENTYGAASLKLPVDLTGWYGVYVGYVTGSQGMIVSAGSQSKQLTMDGGASGDLYGSKAIVEEFALASNFSSGTVWLNPIPGKPARIAYIKLRGLSPNEIDLYNMPDEGATGKRVIYNNDGYSDYFSGKFDTEQGLLNNAVNILANQDANSLYWALGTTMLILRDSDAAGTPYASLTPAQEQNLMRDGDKHAKDTVLSYVYAGKDPLAIVAEGANDIGLDAFASLRMGAFYNQNVYPWLNGNRYEEFVDKGYRQIKSDGTPDIRMSYAYQEFRQYVIDVLKEAGSVVDENGQLLVKGVELDYCRYPNVLGYEPILVNGYIQLYGVDPRQDTSSAGQQRWNAYKAGIMTAFMEDVRDQLPGLKIAVRIPYDSYMQNGLDIETWIQEQLIDRLAVCTVSHETFFDEIDSFRTMTAGTNVTLYGNINGTLSGGDLTRQQEELIKRGIRVATGHETLSRQQYMLRAHQFYEAGYDGIYIFNNWRGSTSDGQTILSQLGDKVKLSKWYHFGYPAEWVQNLVTVGQPN